MKRNYYIFIIIFLVVIFRTNILSLFMNTKKLFIKESIDEEIYILREENRKLKD